MDFRDDTLCFTSLWAEKLSSTQENLRPRVKECTVMWETKHSWRNQWQCLFTNNKSKCRSSVWTIELPSVQQIVESCFTEYFDEVISLILSVCHYLEAFVNYFLHFCLSSLRFVNNSLCTSSLKIHTCIFNWPKSWVWLGHCDILILYYYFCHFVVWYQRLLSCWVTQSG